MIKRTDLSRVLLMPFSQTMVNVGTHLRAENLVDLKLKEIADSTFFPALAAMDEALKQARVTGITQILLELDEKRDAMVIRLGQHLETFADYPIAAVAEAAKRLLLTLRKYGKSIQNLSGPGETSTISNLVQDYSLPDAQADLAATMAGAWMDEMAKANQEYQSAADERTRKDAQYAVGKAREARLALQDAFTDLAKMIDAQALINGPAKYGQLAANINAEIDAALQAAKQRASARVRSEDKPGMI